MNVSINLLRDKLIQTLEVTNMLLGAIVAILSLSLIFLIAIKIVELKKKK